VALDPGLAGNAVTPVQASIPGESLESLSEPSWATGRETLTHLPLEPLGLAGSKSQRTQSPYSVPSPASSSWTLPQTVCPPLSDKVEEWLLPQLPTLWLQPFPLLRMDCHPSIHRVLLPLTYPSPLLYPDCFSSLDSSLDSGQE
jgi:hypothetical protein